MRLRLGGGTFIPRSPGVHLILRRVDRAGRHGRLHHDLGPRRARPSPRPGPANAVGTVGTPAAWPGRPGSACRCSSRRCAGGLTSGGDRRRPLRPRQELLAPVDVVPHRADHHQAEARPSRPPGRPTGPPRWARPAPASAAVSGGRSSSRSRAGAAVTRATLNRSAASPRTACRCGADTRRTCPWWFSTIRRTMSSPRPVPLPDLLRGEERLEQPALQLGGHAGAVVADLDRDVIRRRGRVRMRDGAVAVHRVDRVVEQVRPHLVELRGVRRDRAAGSGRSRGPAARRPSSACGQHRQRALDAVVDVDRLRSARGPCRCSPSPPPRSPRSGRCCRAARVTRPRAVERGDHPVERRAEGLPGVALDPREPLLVDARLGQRRRQPPALQPLVVQQVDQRVLAVGRLQPAAGPCATRPAPPPPRCSSTRLPASSRSTPLHTKRAERVVEHLERRRASSDALRRAAAAGLLSSCASPAERVPRARASPARA